ncbi:MAG: trigger factor, partial [Clostridia bacterium]|nr:trigger factor [Clostridia bacterium]
MNYNKEILENSEIKYVVEADSSAWQNAIREAYNKTKHKFNIEGFRKGKAPMSVITRMYGVGVFFDDALDIILQSLYTELLEKETELVPVARPNVDIVAISDSELKVAFTITVTPEFTLGEYKGLKLKKVSSKVTDEMIAEEITKAQEKAGAWEDVTDRACQKFDTVVIDYSGSVDGVKFEGGTAEKQNLELGSGMFIPGFEEQVEGMKIGEEKDITVKFPEEYGAENLAGKDAVFAIKLHEIKKKVLPEVNDEFAKDVSEFDTVEDYKADIKAKLQKTAEDKANREMENALLDKIAENTEINIPDAMIEEQIEEMIQEFEYRLAYQGMKPEDYYK